MMYEMNWMLTNAQIELIAADVNVIDYDYGDKKKKKKGEFDNTKASASDVRKAGEEWLERYGNDEKAGTGLSMSDILKGGLDTSVGIKIEQ